MLAFRELVSADGTVSIQDAENIARDIILKAKECTPEQIIERVGAHYSVSSENIVGRSREKSISLARHVSMYLIRQLTDLTLDEVGKLFGKDHSTVIHSIRKIEDLLDDDLTLSDTVRDIITDVKELNSSE
jgi:chromosomal replication initiator protein